jgi:hypothetical protein
VVGVRVAPGEDLTLARMVGPGLRLHEGNALVALQVPQDGWGILVCTGEWHFPPPRFQSLFFGSCRLICCSWLHGEACRAEMGFATSADNALCRLFLRSCA